MKTRYLANREWSRNFKFNNYWYLLKSLYDDTEDGGLFDFDLTLNDEINDTHDFDNMNMDDDHWTEPKLHRRRSRPKRVKNKNLSNYDYDSINMNDDHWTEPALYQRFRLPRRRK